MNVNDLTDSNRINIPAVCRIRDANGATVGSGVIIGTGVLLTSTLAVPTKQRAEELTAVFFEGTKKKVVEAKLLPKQLFFSAVYPEYMNYCLVGVEQAGIIHVTPVRVPLVRKEWPTIVEGDVVLVVQHPIASATSAVATTTATVDVHSDSSGSAKRNDTGEEKEEGSRNKLEVKKFEEVLQVHNDVYLIQTDSFGFSAGCPCFNDDGKFIGLQSQQRVPNEGVVSRILSVSCIVKHLFANSYLARLPQKDLLFEDVWDTWFIDRDVSRVIAILSNFRSREMVRLTTHRLCALTNNAQLVPSIAECGGISIILANLLVFPDDQELAAKGVRALWNITIEEDSRLSSLVVEGGVETVLTNMEAFPTDEDVQQFGTVLLHNVAASVWTPGFTDERGHRTMRLVSAAMTRFKDVVVLQKSGLSLFTLVVGKSRDLAMDLTRTTELMDHIIYLLQSKSNHVLLMEALFSFIAVLAQCREASEAYFEQTKSNYNASMVNFMNLIVDVMSRYKLNDTILVHGNCALWGFGNNVTCRTAILQNPQSTEVLQYSQRALIANEANTRAI